MHPTLAEELAKALQRDRLAQAAQYRLARGARETEPHVTTRKERRWRRLTRWQLKQAA
jgi:hypothetical protein